MRLARGLGPTALSALALALAACGHGAPPDPVTSPLHRALLGSWCNPAPQGGGCWAWDDFRPDGTLHLCGRHDDEATGFAATARVSFDGRRLCYVVLQATPNFWLPPGQRYCTEIVEVQADRHDYVDLDTGQRFTLLRRPGEQRRCPPVAAAVGEGPLR